MSAKRASGLVAALLVVAGCGGPEQTASRYIQAVNAKRFGEAEALLDARTLEYVGPGGLEASYKDAKATFRIEKTVVSGVRAVATIAPQGADAGPSDVPALLKTLVVKQQDKAWHVVDCLSAANVMSRATEAKNYDKALTGVALINDNHCDDAAMPGVEANILSSKGDDAYHQGAYERATEALQRSLTLEETAHVHYTLGYVYRDNKAITNNMARAVEEFRAAVRLSPDSAEYHSALADVYRQSENTDGAIGEFKKAIELNPIDKQTHFFYALALIAKNRYREAADELETVTALDPNYRNAAALLRNVRQYNRVVYRGW